MGQVETENKVCVVESMCCHCAKRWRGLSSEWRRQCKKKEEKKKPRILNSSQAMNGATPTVRPSRYLVLKCHKSKKSPLCTFLFTSDFGQTRRGFPAAENLFFRSTTVFISSHNKRSVEMLSNSWQDGNRSFENGRQWASQTKGGCVT